MYEADEHKLQELQTDLGNLVFLWTVSGRYHRATKLLRKAQLILCQAMGEALAEGEKK